MEVKMPQAFPVLVVVNLPPIAIQMVVLLSSVLMNGAVVYVSIMLLLLLASASASDLSRCYSCLTMRLVTHYQLSDCLFGETILLAYFC
jgi:hypothetical protein